MSEVTKVASPFNPRRYFLRSGQPKEMNQCLDKAMGQEKGQCYILMKLLHELCGVIHTQRKNC